MAEYLVKDGMGIIPNGTIKIVDFAFWDCKELTNVIIPDSVKEIGLVAFKGCSSLTSITIPASVKLIRQEAFKGCSALNEIIVDKENTVYDSREGCNAIIGPNDVLLYGCNTTVIPTSVKKIAEGAFSSCLSLKSITIPQGVKKISRHAFSRCQSLAYISIPDGIEKIGRGIFGSCTSLTEIEIPENSTKIVKDMLAGCSSLTNVKIPSSVTELEDSCFQGCKSLTNIIIPKSVKSIGERAFLGCESLTHITIPEGIEVIKEGTFRRCKSLESIIIPASVTEIGWIAFEDCTSLKEITLPAGLKIRKDSFEGCKSINTIYVPAKKTDYYKKRLPESMHSAIVEMAPPSSKPAKKTKVSHKETPKVEKLSAEQIKALNGTILTFGINMDADEALERCDYPNLFDVEFYNHEWHIYGGDTMLEYECINIYEEDNDGNPIEHTNEIRSFVKPLVREIARCYNSPQSTFNLWGLEEYHISYYILRDKDYNNIDEGNLDIDLEKLF